MVCILLLHAFVRQTIASLEDEHCEHEDATCWFAPDDALARVGVHAVTDGAKYLPVDSRIEPVQWAAGPVLRKRV